MTVGTFAQTGKFLQSPEALCESCKFVLSAIDLRSPVLLSTQISNLCHTTNVEKCETLQKFLPQIQEAKKSKISSTEICSSLSLCGQPTTISGASCAACQAGLGLVQHAIAAGKLDLNQPQLFCGQTASMKVTCTLFFNAYGPKIQRELATGDSIAEICHRLQYCRDLQALHFGQFIAALLDSVAAKGDKLRIDSKYLRIQLNRFNPTEIPTERCQSCQWTVSAIESYLSNNRTEVELDRVLKEVCSLFPGVYGDACANFVTLYIDEAIQFLISTITPPRVCNQFSFCFPG